MKKPTDKHKNNDDTSRLFFSDGEDADYYMRGGIFWPDVDSKGYIVLGGQNVKTRKVTVFEECEFVTINNILGEGNRIEHKGVASFFNHCWNQYFARKYYWHQGDELHRTHRLEVVRSRAVINPQPILTEVAWPNEKDIRALIWKYRELGWIAIQEDGGLASAMLDAKESDKMISPAVHALQCMLVGFERYPWRKKV